MRMSERWMKNGCDIHLRFVGRIFTELPYRLVIDNYFYFENGGKNP
jgi:hypothetical protein